MASIELFCFLSNKNPTDLQEYQQRIFVSFFVLLQILKSNVNVFLSFVFNSIKIAELPHYSSYTIFKKKLSIIIFSRKSKNQHCYILV